MATADVHMINEDLFRQVLGEHFPRWVVDPDTGAVRFCKCGILIDGRSLSTQQEKEQNWIDHVLYVGARTPLRIEGASL